MHLKWTYKTIQDKTMWIPLTWAREKKGGRWTYLAQIKSQWLAG